MFFDKFFSLQCLRSRIERDSYFQDPGDSSFSPDVIFFGIVMEMESIIDVSGLPDVEFVDGIRINDIDEKLLHGKKKTPQSAWSLLLLLDSNQGPSD